MLRLLALSLLTVEICMLHLHSLPSSPLIAQSSSPPYCSIHSGSTLLGLLLLLLGVLCWISDAIAGWKALPITLAPPRCGDVVVALGVDNALLLDTVAHWMVAICYHNRGCVDGVAALVSFQLLL
jgi:hypothetical protein